MIKILATQVTVESIYSDRTMVKIQDSQNEARLLAIQQFLKSLEPADLRIQAQCDEYVEWLKGWLGQ